MRTLFSPDILGPPPQHVPESLQNPLELSFPPNPLKSATGSSSSSPGQNDWLTQQLQNQLLLSATDTPSSHSGSDGAQRYASFARRKGNPKILFMGMRRSGKSSIQKVIFEKMSPAETLYLDPTHRVQSASMESFITLESLELPPTLPFTAPDFDHASIFASAGAIVWVLDMQDEYYASIAALVRAAVFCREHYPRLHLEVFVHKTDGLSEEYKADTFRDVRQRVQDELSDAIATLPPHVAATATAAVTAPGGGTGSIGSSGGDSVSFYATSVFDHSIYEATSRVVQKLLPQLPAVEALLNRLCSTCSIQKAYLFDTASKIYIATDASPTFLRDYEVCSDYVDVIVDVKQIYGWSGTAAEPEETQRRRRYEGAGSDDEDYDDDYHDEEDVVAERKPTTMTSRHAEDQPFAAAPAESAITFERSGETYIYAREMNAYLTLICVMGHGSTPDKRVLVDYNVTVLKEALEKIFSTSAK